MVRRAIGMTFERVMTRGGLYRATFGDVRNEIGRLSTDSEPEQRREWPGDGSRSQRTPSSRAVAGAGHSQLAPFLSTTTATDIHQPCSILVMSADPPAELSLDDTISLIGERSLGLAVLSKAGQRHSPTSLILS